MRLINYLTVVSNVVVIEKSFPGLVGHQVINDELIAVLIGGWEAVRLKPFQLTAEGSVSWIGQAGKVEIRGGCEHSQGFQVYFSPYT